MPVDPPMEQDEQARIAEVVGLGAIGSRVAQTALMLGMEVIGYDPALSVEAAWRLRGFENFMIDLVQRPHLAAYLLDQLTSMLIENALILSRSGVDILLLDDDVAMPNRLMLGPDTWREYFKPRLVKVINLTREESPEILIFYHCDGDFTRLIPDLVDIGVNVINPVQPDCMDAAAIKKEFGDKPAMWGTVGTSRLWDWGDTGIRCGLRCKAVFGNWDLKACCWRRHWPKR